MGLKLEDKYRIQERRSEKFPEDRIPFWTSKESAYRDTKIFEEYLMLGDQVIDTLRMKMASNNYLVEISREQFRNEARLLGYDPNKEPILPKRNY